MSTWQKHSFLSQLKITYAHWTYRHFIAILSFFFFTMFLLYFYDGQSIQNILTCWSSVCSFLCLLGVCHMLMKLLYKIVKWKITSLSWSSSSWEKSKPNIWRSLILLALIVISHATSKILVIIYTEFVWVKILKIG